MSTSEREGRVAIASTMLGDEAPVSAYRSRLAINNAHHYADQRCFHLVNWVAPNSAVIGGNLGIRTPNPLSVSYQRVAVWGPLPITVHSDGRPYPMRMRLAGATSSGAVACTFGLVLSTTLGIGSEVLEHASLIDGLGVVFAPTSSTAAAWLSVASGAALMDPSRGLATRASRATLVDTGGDACDVETAEIYVTAFAKAATLFGTPQLYGVHVSQYVGV